METKEIKVNHEHKYVLTHITAEEEDPKEWTLHLIEYSKEGLVNNCIIKTKDKERVEHLNYVLYLVGPICDLDLTGWIIGYFDTIDVLI